MASLMRAKSRASGTLQLLLVVLFSTSRQEATSDKRDHCPKHCVCMYNQAYCDNVGLKRMPRDFPQDLQAVHMRDNHVSRLRYVHLEGQNALKHLMLKGNRIRLIEPNAFLDLSSLVALSLTENKIRHLSPDTFSPLKKLHVFSLRNNQISNIDHLFHGLRRLSLLNLGNNRIRKISHRAFRFNWNLRILDMHNNRLKYIHKNAFRSMLYLKFLVLRDNPLKTIELDFRRNFHMELLDATNCQLSEVIKGMPYSINDLRLSENNITHIGANDFKTTRRIRLLVLNNNNMEEIDDRALSKLWHLYDIYLGRNKLQKLPPKLPQSIHGIYATHNNITSLRKDTLVNNDKLEYLYLRHNNIQQVDREALWGLTKLRSLDLSHNFIQELKPKTFVDNIYLQKLDLSANPIKEIQQNCFQGLVNLHILELSSVGSNSRIQPSIFKDTQNLLFLDLQNSSQLAVHMAENPYALDYIHSVKDLNLMNDQLYNLPKEFPNHFPHLRMIKLIGNPWHCDESILWLSRWMRNRTVDFFAWDHMVCVSPPEMKGVKIPELTWDMVPNSRGPPGGRPYVDLVKVKFKHIQGNKSVSYRDELRKSNLTKLPPSNRTLLKTENPGNGSLENDKRHRSPTSKQPGKTNNHGKELQTVARDRSHLPRNDNEDQLIWDAIHSGETQGGKQAVPQTDIYVKWRKRLTKRRHQQRNRKQRQELQRLLRREQDISKPISASGTSLVDDSSGLVSGEEYNPDTNSIQ